MTGEIVTVEGQLFTGTQRFAIGAQVPMLYRLEKPNEARVALFIDNWIGPCIAAWWASRARRRLPGAALHSPRAGQIAGMKEKFDKEYYRRFYFDSRTAVVSRAEMKARAI